MRTLAAIIESAKTGDSLTKEEGRYAICALDSLLSDAEENGKNRVMAALSEIPKEWLGWGDGHKNSEYLEIEQGLL